jgi:hypothetical protein
VADKTRDEIIAEVRADAAQGVSDWYFDRETGKFYTSEGKDLGFAFFPHKSIFQNSEGYMIELRRVNYQTVSNFQAAYDKKYAPKVPMKRIKIDEGEYYSEGNLNDPAYQDERQRHENNMNIIAAAYQMSLAVKNKLPERANWDDYFHQQIEALEELSDEPLKDYVIRYEWINSMLPTNTELVVFIQIVVGADLPTVEALRKAEERFHSSGGDNGREKVPSS